MFLKLQQFVFFCHQTDLSLFPASFLWHANISVYGAQLLRSILPASGRPIKPRFSRTFLALAPKFLHPGNIQSPGQTRPVGYPASLFYAPLKPCKEAEGRSDWVSEPLSSQEHMELPHMTTPCWSLMTSLGQSWG